MLRLITIPLLGLFQVGCHLLSDGAIGETCEDLPAGCDGLFGFDDTSATQSDDTAVSTDDTGHIADDSGLAPTGIPRISSVEPTYGPNTGNVLVEIVGENLVGTTSVSFGDAASQPEAGSVSPTGLTVELPSTGEQGWVSVSLERSDDEQATMDDGFYLFEGAPDDVGFAAILQSAEGLGEFASLPIEQTIQAGFVSNPTYRPREALGPSIDTCVNYRDALHPIPGSDELDGRTELTLQTDSADFILSDLEGDGVFETSLTEQDLYRFGGTYSFAPFTIPDLFEVTLSDILQPAAPIVVDEDLTGDLESLVLGANFPMKWDRTPGTDTSLVMFKVTLLAEGEAPSPVAPSINGIVCVAEDDGFLRVDQMAWLDYDRTPGEPYWDDDGTLWIEVGRYDETITRLPTDGRKFRFGAIEWQHFKAATGARPLTECENGSDDDADGWIDLDDPACADGSETLREDDGFDTSIECNDGVDNDEDSFIDSEDSGCLNGWDPSEASVF